VKGVYALAKKRPTTAVVYDLAKPITDELGLILWDVRFEKEGSSWFLRVILDKKDGTIDMDDCEAVSRRLDPLLDETDPIEQSYFLEVGSAGLGRELRSPQHFEACLGMAVRARLIRSDETGRREVEGILESYEDGIATVLEEDGKHSRLIVKDCSYIKLNDDSEIGQFDN
jgi:ribosome maturation factor RimP